MTTYRLGKPYTPRQPRGEPPASGFRMWTWAAGGSSSGNFGFNCSGRVVWQGPPELDPLLNAREEECWRMFGITVEYYQDERIISFPPPPPTWATKTPDEVLADVRAAIEWAMLPERDISAELWEQLTPSQRLTAWRYYHGS